MRGANHAHQRVYLVTGATGFLGHHILAELLNCGRFCVAAVRPPLAHNRIKLIALLEALNGDAHGGWKERLLDIVELDLPDRSSLPKDLHCREIIHCAGKVDLTENASRELRRVNTEGTRQMCAWAAQTGCRSFHLLSTAYVCGTAEVGCEEPAHAFPGVPFNNAYERSKYEAEMIVQRWAGAPERSATVFRPSVVVGASTTGRATAFQGFYFLAKATELLERSYRNRSRGARRAIRLRILGSAEDPYDLVPVDYVAQMVTAIVTDPEMHGRVYHLTHPDPPSGADIKGFLERYFDIAGGSFVAPGTPLGALSEAEQLFYRLPGSIVKYLQHAPRFQRKNTSRAEAQCHICCPPADYEFIKRVLDYAGSRHSVVMPSPANGNLCRKYFEVYLPRMVPQSTIARMSALTTCVHFTILGWGGYQCTCCFEHGRLTRVVTAANGAYDYGYCTTYPTFLEAISGGRTPQSLFLAREAHIEGDIEKGLKMAMILHEFTKEHPCDERMLKGF